MLPGVFLIISGILLIALAILLAFSYGLYLGRRSTVPWLVRPHTARTLERMPLPEQGSPTVSQAAYVRTNLPNSTSTME